MELTFTVDASGFPQYTANKLDQLNAALTSKLDNLNAELQRRIVANLQGPILNQVTGKAARSVEAVPAVNSGDAIEGAVQAGGGPAFYLKFQEDGTNGPYEIAAKGKALAFMIGGKLAFFRRIQHPGLEARRPVGSTFDAFQPEMIAGLQAVPGEVGAQ